MDLLVGGKLRRAVAWRPEAGLGAVGVGAAGRLCVSSRDCAKGFQKEPWAEPGCQLESYKGSVDFSLRQGRK